MTVKKCFFVHVPKTAGICFKINLQKFYEESRSLHVYLSEHLDKKNIDDYDLVTGHIQPLKNDLSNNRLLVTWLRDPVDRLVSLYFYQNHYDASNSDSDKQCDSTVDISKFYDDIERYAFNKENRDVIYKDYFYYLDIDNFDFIGVYEDFHNDQNRFFQKFFGQSMDFQFLTNTNTMIDKSRSNNYDIDSNLRKRIEQCNPRDMDLYHRVLDLKNKS